MSSVTIQGNPSGTGIFTVASPNSNTNQTITLPDASGTLLTNSGTEPGAFSTLSVAGNNISAFNSLGFRNRIINGDMRIDQRNNGASVNSSGGGTFSVDRFTSFGAGGGVYTTQRSTDVPTGQGFVNSIVSTVTTTDSPTGIDYYLLTQAIEGFNIADLGWGTASARPVTISFWVKASLTGTYTVALRNNALNRSYLAPYAINSANTWEQKTITVAGDTTGTWLTDNGVGIRLGFTLGAGSDYIDTGNVWSASEDFAATGQTQWIATSGATFYLTGVQLEAGSVATPFERRDYGRELIMCRRYARPFGEGALGIWVNGNIARVKTDFDVVMRASPTIVMTITNPVVELWNVAAYTGSGSSLVSPITSATMANPSINGFSSGQSYGAPAYSQGNFAFLSAEL